MNLLKFSNFILWLSLAFMLSAEHDIHAGEEISLKIPRAKKIRQCKSTPRVNRAFSGNLGQRCNDFRCRCSSEGCIAKIGGYAQVLFIQGKLDGLLKENPSCGRIRQSDMLGRYIDFKDFDKAQRACWAYYLYDYKNLKIQVCQNAFLLGFGISQKRLNTVRNSSNGMILPQLCQSGKSPNPLKTSDARIADVRAHITSLQVRGSHYCREKMTRTKFLDSDLDCMKLWDMYKKLYSEPVGYRIYYNTFKEYDLKFGFPRSDKCEVCDNFSKLESQSKRKGSPEEIARIIEERRIHRANGDAFYDEIKARTQESQLDKDRLVLCFDFQKNMPLPLTNIGPEYYKRQLWVYNFGIHNYTNNTATMFMYAEHFARKSPNEVISCLEFYLNRCVQDRGPEFPRYLDLFCDNCAGQNKNRYVFLFCQYLADSGRFEKVTLNFPMPGHSYMACDRDFGTIESSKKKKEVVLAPSGWVQTVRNAKRKAPPFEVVYVQHPLTDSMEPDGTPIVKVKDFKTVSDVVLADSVEGLTKFRGLQFTKAGTSAKNSLLDKGYPISVNLLNKKSRSVQLSKVFQFIPCAYDSFLPISDAKLADVKYLLKFYDLPETCVFYNYLSGNAGVPDYEEEEVEL